MSDLLYQDETYRIRGAIFEVCQEKGCRFLEPVYLSKVAGDQVGIV